MALEKTDCIVAGAGVVGLAIARALAQAGREVIVIDRADRIGSETSSRNSEVIHAGIYYPPGSLKARLCVRGRALLYDFCESHAVPHARTGKFIVATHEDQEAELDVLRQRAETNGVDDLRLLSGREAIADQPALFCTAALLSPSTGILDSHAFMLAIQGDAEEAGAFICLKTEITEIEATGSAFVVHTSGDEAFDLECETFINSAGIGAPDLAGKILGLSEETVPDGYLAKGNYFRLAARAPFSRLIYPVPEPGGLGVHITIDMGGQARFGPDVEWVETLDYEVDPQRCESFYAAVRRYWPGLPDASLVPDYSGIRPKITGQGEAAADFRISDETEHKLPGLVNLYGIESPGLTSALAIAEEVKERL